MASPTRRLQPATGRGHTANSLSLGGSRNAIDRAAKDDPLQPLKAMADRVGKEVEKFAERVDHWHTHGNEDAKAKYSATLQLVGDFKNVAASTVKELKKQNGAENKGELQKSVLRRIQDMAQEEQAEPGGRNARPSQAVGLAAEVNSIPHSTRVQELRHWETEAATWDLLHIIIEHYHPAPGTDVAARKRSQLAKVGGATRYSPNTEIWNRFLLEDDEAKEKELIIRWLQQSAKNTESDIESITKQLEQQSKKDTATWTSGWLDTKAKIKLAKLKQGADRPLKPDFELYSDDGRLNLVTQLDPDAPGRQRKALDYSDEYYERALWMVCYEMLRRGVPWEEIGEWCKAKSEGWRAVSIGASSEPHVDGAPNLSGHTVGFLFRRMCVYAASGSLTQYQAAVYGLLSGSRERVTPICRSWDDHLYAHYNALLLSRFDNYLMKNHPKKVPQTLTAKFTFHDAVSEIGEWNNSSKRVIDLLKEQKSTAALSSLPMKLIQGALISRNVEELITEVGEAIVLLLQRDRRATSIIIDPESDVGAPTSFVPDTERSIASNKYHQGLATDPHALRVLVHIFIIFRKGLGLFDMRPAPKWATMDNVVGAYIEFLRITRRYQLIPIYAAQLEGKRVIHCLSRVLPDIKNPEEQKNIIHLLEQYDIDPAEVISQNYTITSSREFGHNPSEYISRFEILERTREHDDLWPGHRVKRNFAGRDLQLRDEALIETLRWLPHLDKDIRTTFESLQSGLIFLLLNGRVGAAETLVNELGLETISLIKTKSYCGYGFDFTTPGTEQQDQDELTHAAREQLSSSGRSSLRPSDLPSAAEHREYVLDLREASQTYFELQQLVRLIALFREWREEEDSLIRLRNSGVPKVSLKKAKDILEAIETTLEPVLENFLGAFEPGSSADRDAWTIRKAYIPEVILAFISVTHTMAYFSSRETPTKAMDIATVVADEERAWLQKAFLQTGRMKELVNALAKVSTAMLKLCEPDPKGRVPAKKHGKKGENLRIWDVNVKN